MSSEVMVWLVRLGQLLLSLSILILLHEMGHFLAARAFKTKVEKFFLFFDWKFALIKKKVGDTVYGIGWIPLGGYVKIAGMVDESMDKEQMKKPPEPWEYRSKPAWQRLIIITAGVIVNLFLGWFIYSMTLFVWGEKYIPNDQLVHGISVTDSLGYQLGLQDGDKIVAIDGEPVERFETIMGRIVINQADNITVERNGEKINIPVPVEFIRDAINIVKKTSIIQPRMPFYVGGFTEDSPGQKAGLKEKDKIVELNGQPVQFFDEFLHSVEAYKNQEVKVRAVRNSDTLDFFMTTTPEGKIGVSAAGFDYLKETGDIQVNTKHYGFFEAFPAGVLKAKKTIVDYAKQLKLIFTPKTGAYKQVGGFKSMASIFPSTWSWEAFWNLTAFLSLVLAFMNILPIPALDGGHMIFILVEMVTGRKPSDKFMEKAQLVGFVLLLGLMLYANLNDFI